MNERQAKWHQMTAEAACRELHSNAARGISHRAARSRIKKSGTNTLFDGNSRSAWNFLRPLFFDPAWLLSLLFALTTLFFGNIWSGITVIVFQTALSVFLLFQFRGFSKAEQRIGQYRIPRIRVVREGKLFSASARAIAQGDILLLQKGDIVPCDCRLLSSDSLRVLTLFPDEGKPKYHEFSKNADTVYPYGHEISAPLCENMLYGGSEILCGEARAIVVEIGEYTFLGAMKAFRIPGEITSRNGEREITTAFTPYLRLYGIFAIMGILILTLIGLFTLPKNYQITDLFLPLCTLLAISSPALIGLYLRFMELSSLVSTTTSRTSKSGAVIKNLRACEMACRMQELILVGHSAMSDGVLHFWRAVCNKQTIDADGKEKSPCLQPLCEAFCILSQAQYSAISAKRKKNDIQSLDFLPELCLASGFDVGALQVRLLHAECAVHQGNCCLDVTLRERHFQLLFSYDEVLPRSCVLYEDGGRLLTVSPTYREILTAFYDEAKRNAARTVTVLRRNDEGTVSLVGILAVRENFQKDLPAQMTQMQELGIRTTVLLTGKRDIEIAYANAAGLSDKLHLATGMDFQLKAENLDPSGGVYVGFDSSALQSLIDDLRAKGHRVALCGGAIQDRSILLHAPLLLVPCSSLSNGVIKGDRPMEIHSVQGGKESTDSAQMLQRRADIILPAASHFKGGMAAIVECVMGLRTNRYQMRTLFSFLVLSQLARWMSTSLMLIFGIGLPNTLALWLFGGLFDLFATLRFSAASVPVEKLCTYAPLAGNGLKGQFSLKKILPCLIASIVASLLAGILTWCGVMPLSVAHTALQIAILPLEMAIYYTVALQMGVRLTKRDLLLPILLFVLSTAIAIFFSCIFAPVAELTGFGDWSVFSIILVPISTLVLLLCNFLLHQFHRTAK